MPPIDLGRLRLRPAAGTYRAATRSAARRRPNAARSRLDGLADLTIRDLPSLLRPGDILVANDTRVFPAQLQATRGKARIGITLDQPRADGVWNALARNGRRLRPYDQLAIEGAPALTAQVIDKAEDGSLSLTFNLAGDALMQAFEQRRCTGVTALYPPPRRADARGCRGLPDRVRPAAGRGRRSDRRPAFYSGSTRRIWKQPACIGSLSRCMSGSAPSCRYG